MKTAYEILRVTDKKRKARAAECQLLDFKVQSKMDVANLPYAHVIGHVACPATPIQPWASGNAYKVELHLYPPVGKGGYSWVSCNGSDNKTDFLYRWEVALTTKGSSDIRYSNAKPPRITNPAEIPGACKHVIKVLQRAVRDRSVQKVIFQLDTRGKRDRMPASSMLYMSAIKVAKDIVDEIKDKVKDPKKLKIKAMQVVRKELRGKMDAKSIEKSVAGFLDRYLKKLAKKASRDDTQSNESVELVDFSQLLIEGTGIPGYDDTVMALHEKASILWYYYNNNPERLNALLDSYIEQLNKEQLKENGSILYNHYYNESWLEELKKQTANDLLNNLL